MNSTERPPPPAVGLVPSPMCLLSVSFHATDVNMPAVPGTSSVPPTAVTSGSLSGQEVTG